MNVNKKIKKTESQLPYIVSNNIKNDGLILQYNISKMKQIRILGGN